MEPPGGWCGPRMETASCFASRRDGAADIYVKPVNGSTDEEILLKSAENKIPTSWSRDSLLLYTVSSSKTKLDIWVLQLAGDETDPLPANDVQIEVGRLTVFSGWALGCLSVR